MNQKELFVLSVMVFLSIVAWMLVDIYKTKTSVSVSSDFTIGPAVNYKVDPAVLQQLKAKTP